MCFLDVSQNTWVFLSHQDCDSSPASTISPNWGSLKCTVPDLTFLPASDPVSSTLVCSLPPGCAPYTSKSIELNWAHRLSPSHILPLVLCALLCPWRSLADPTQRQHHRLLCMPHAPVLQPLTAALGPAFLTSPLSCCPTASKRISQPQPLLLSPFLSISPSFIAQRTF